VVMAQHAAIEVGHMYTWTFGIRVYRTVDEAAAVQNEDTCLEVMANIPSSKLIIVRNGAASDLGSCYVSSCCLPNEPHRRWFAVAQ
jgi:hypothetical protein